MSSIFSRILVGVDDSERARAAAAIAARLAREHGGELVLCHAVRSSSSADLTDWDRALGDKPDDASTKRAHAVLDAAAQRATPFGVVAERRIVEGDGANAIIRVAAETASRLIVVGTHHGVGVQALLIGSVTDAVLRASTLPVLTIGRDIQFSDEAHRCFERVLVAIDDSETSEAAIETAFRLPQEDRRKLVFCSVAGVDGESGPARRSLAVAEGITGRALAFARARGIAAHSRVLEGNPREALLIVAAQERADVIILGSHGRRGIDRLLLGSVAESVARTAPLPVLVVPVSGVVGVTKRTAATGGPS